MLGGKDANSDEDIGSNRKPSKGKGRGRKESGTTSSSGSSNMHQSTSRSSTKDLLRQLPEDFEPGEYDVICSRGKWAMNAPGNVRYRTIIKNNLQKYSATSTKQEKSAIVSEIVESIQSLCPDGGFVRSVNGRWYTVTDHIAREKTGQSFRDLLHTQYKSSTKAKRRRQKERDLRSDQRTKPAPTKTEPSASQPNQESSTDATTPNSNLSLSSVASQVFPNVPNHGFNGNMMPPQAGVFPPQVGPNAQFQALPNAGMFTGHGPQHFMHPGMPGMPGMNYNTMAFTAHNTHALQPQNMGFGDQFEPFLNPNMLHHSQQQQQQLQAMQNMFPPQAQMQEHPILRQQQGYLQGSGPQQVPNHFVAKPSSEDEQVEQHPLQQTLRQYFEPIPLHEAPDDHPVMLEMNGANKTDSFDGILDRGLGFTASGHHDDGGSGDDEH